MPPIPAPPAQEGPAGARKRLAQVLMVVRSPDPPGAFAAIAEDGPLVDLIIQFPGDEPEALWSKMVTRSQELAEAQRCLRCGTCCRKSSPTLYADDLPTIEAGNIDRKRLYTLRAGEMVRDPRSDEQIVLENDLIKLYERSGGGCYLLDDHLCSTYEHRPLQCRNLECWSGRHAGELEDHPRLTRQQLFRDDETALQLIEEMDVKLPASGFTEALLAAREGEAEATGRAIEFIEVDHRLRAAIEERYGFEASEQELLFGRDAIEVVRSHGLVINLEDQEHPAIVPR